MFGATERDTTNNFEITTSTIFTRATPITQPILNRPHRQPLSPPQHTITVYHPLHSAQYHLMPIADISPAPPSPVPTIQFQRRYRPPRPIECHPPAVSHRQHRHCALGVCIHSICVRVRLYTGHREQMCAAAAGLGGAGRKWGGGECSDCR